jgi:DNA-binding response OmpR family regulator
VQWLSRGKNAGPRTGCAAARPYDDAVDPRVLLVEDDATIGRSLEQSLRAQGYLTDLEVDGNGALRAFAQMQPDLIVLDLGLPDVDGVDLCREFRASAASVAIIVLTARADEIDVVIGLDAGANDYVTKPFRLGELLARIRALLRRSDLSVPIEIGDLTVDVDARRAWVGGRETKLSPREFDLLALLSSEAGRAVTRERIMTECWDEHWFGSTKTLDVHVSQLRSKLARSGTPRTPTISVLRRVGYRLDVP